MAVTTRTFMLYFSRRPMFGAVVLLTIGILIYIYFGSPLPASLKLPKSLTSQLKTKIKVNKGITINKRKTVKTKIKVHKGNVDTDGCSVVKINPFDNEVMKYMKDFGEHICKKTLEVTVNKDEVHVSGDNVNFIRSSEIVSADDDAGFKLLDSAYLLKPRVSQPDLIKGRSGAIQNLASKRCIAPKEYDIVKPPKEIDLVYTSVCVGEQVQFTFTDTGIIIHNATKRCAGPAGNLEIPFKDSKFVLSAENCKHIFHTVYDGVIQHADKVSCLHPLGGGNLPEENQSICFYPECPSEQRLMFRWHVVDKAASEKSSVEIELKKELNYVEVSYADDKSDHAFLLCVQPKPIVKPERKDLPNVYVIVLDEVSSAHFQRKLSQSYKYMVEDMQFLEYGVYSAVTGSVKENIMAFLTGDSPADVSKKSSSLYEFARKSNYATLFSGDTPSVINTDLGSNHTSIPLFRALKKHYDVTAHSHCVASQPVYELTFDYLRSFIKAYADNPKFAVAILSEITKGNFNLLGYMDSYLKRFLQEVEQLQNTVIIIQTVKGSSLGKLSQLKAGLYEYRRPLLTTYVSKDLRGVLSFEVERTGHLATPYDVYATLSQLLSASLDIKHIHGRSLFEKVKPRNCKMAGISSFMCPCI